MEKNHTSITEISLLGFQNLHNFKIPLFTLFLLMYILTICENVLIIALVSTSRNLQTPMYFFLQNLSISDLLVTANIVPIMLQTIINKEVTLSLVGCITQLYLFAIFETFQCLLLTVMSYDRYLAIGNPLRYSSIMNHRVCVKFIFMAWTIGCSIMLIPLISLAMLQFCKPNPIDHFFCDLAPLLEISCSDTSFVKIQVISEVIFLTFFPLMLIIVSYVYIVNIILKIGSSSERQKVFSTCSSHLAVVSIFYGTLISIYVIGPGNKLVPKVPSLLNTFMVPFFNPVIYSLRNKDIKEAFKKLLCSVPLCNSV
ncbi:hypothetical protein GDO86_007044 [Hymenochirus boettgeri]|uniref:G-protein coupled receptors family 1 profile domain-containing protein n=1 Tax=Hymenochirus boettgeri TaxID=247094 RepID=A0A8T2JDG6_9PIPI|nr:hypothetical protein GDO86_007044 [Hymenochirus boettgeri]